MTDPSESSRAYAAALLQQGRMDLAEPRLREVLSQSPNDPWANSILALCISARKNHREAIAQANRAVAVAPNLAFSYYVKSIVSSAADNEESSLRAIEMAIKLDPVAADYHAHHAGVLLDREKPDLALAAADRALALEATHVTALNMRTHALMQLGRFESAKDSLHQSLAENPENDTTHTAAGFLHLQTGKADQAIEHFLQALRLDPQDTNAKEGLLTALKARHRIYRMFLMWLLWMGRQNAAVRVSMIIGIYVLRNVSRELSRAKPELAPLFMPVAIIAGLFIALLWLANPIFNLLLRMHPIGRHLFTTRRIVRQNVVVSLVVGLLTLLVVGGTGKLTAPVVFGVALLPSLAMSLAYSGRQMGIYLLCTVLLAAMGFGSIVFEQSRPDLGHLAQLIMLLFFHGCLILPIWRMFARDPDATE